MITDMAPADLLLQRAGRLHRHDRSPHGGRPRGLEQPRLLVCQPEVQEGVPNFEGGTKAVYDGHVLLRSWLALKDREDICIPKDIEKIIEDVYDDAVGPDGLPEALRKQWEATKEALDRTKRDYEAKARQFSILPPTYSDDILEDFNRELEEDDPEVHPTLQALTRLSERTVSVVFLQTGEVRALDLASKPEMPLIKKLLHRSITVSHRGVVPALVKKKVPQGWREVSLLRHHRLVELNTEGKAQRGKYLLSLDSEVGLRIVSLENRGE